MGLSPKDPHGLTAWDYAGGIWRELCAIRELQQDEGDTGTIRWLNGVGDAYAGGGLTSDARLVVPVGARWTALAISGSSGGAGADTVEVFRNVPTDLGFITRLVAANGRFSMVNLPDHLQLEEGTVIIARFTILAAADGRFPTLNLATREIHYGPPPSETREGGENLMAENFSAIDPDEEREDVVSYNGAGA